MKSLSFTFSFCHQVECTGASLVAQTVKKKKSLGREDPLEEGMATHSSIRAWRIPMDRGAWQARKELGMTE